MLRVRTSVRNTQFRGYKNVLLCNRFATADTDSHNCQVIAQMLQFAMRKTPPKTPLLALLRALTDEQRATFASDAGTSVSYLYSLASCQRQSAGSGLALSIERASGAMHLRTQGETPVVTMRDLATMCLVAGV